MKKLLFIFLVTSGAAAYAQDGFYLQPAIGAGISNLVQKPANPNLKTVFSYDGQIGVGFHSGHFLLGSGINFMRTGTKATITFMDALGNTIGTEKLPAFFSHLIIPLTAGYDIKMNKRLSFVPTLGCGLSWNISEKETQVDPASGAKQKVTMPSAEFDSFYHRFSVFGVVQANFEYTLNQRMQLTFGPAFNYMLTNMFTNISGAPDDAQHNYSLLLNVGVRRWLGRKLPSAKPAGVKNEQ